MNNPLLLGFYSVKQNASSVKAIAAYLKSHHNYDLLEFAETSKLLAVNLLQQVGYDYVTSLQLVGSNRHKILPHFNIDGKSLIEQIDSLIRDNLLSSYSLLSMKINIDSKNFSESEKGLAITDVRNYSQAKFIGDHGGYLIRVDDAQDTGAPDYLQDYKFDRYILNDCGLIGLQRNLDLTLESISEVVLAQV